VLSGGMGGGNCAAGNGAAVAANVTRRLDLRIS
jgi:hypothetical protein